MCVYIYIYIYIHIHAYVYTSTCIHIAGNTVFDMASNNERKLEAHPHSGHGRIAGH